MLYIFVFIFLLLFPFFRFFIFNLFKILPGAFVDLRSYIRFKRWRECRSYGRIICYTGLFGQGKTKECVRYITDQYRHFDGLMIYDDASGKWVRQQIRVYSNVQLTIPYIQLSTLQQLIECQESPAGVVNLFLIDEASVVFNSREFKSNFSLPALNTILTSRHHRIGIYLTSQRFGHMDALLRQVTSYVYDCHYIKALRIQQIKIYDAWDCENCSNPLLLKPLRVIYTYTSDKVYANYDTYAMVESISKDCTVKGAFEDDDQILQRQGQMYSDPRMVGRRSKRLKRRM